MPIEADHRLPRAAIPAHYDLVLEPDLAAATFAGRVSIDLDVVEPTDRIVLNAAELDVTSATLDADNGGGPWTGAVTPDPERERASISFEDQRETGRYRLHLDFTGILNDQLRGFYRSAYQDDEGVEHVLATTQFEATEARRAFPCWDEPDLKATFDITLIVAPGLQVVSNSPIVGDETTADGRRRVRFGTTMKMSTYLVAFVVGELEATDWHDVEGVPLRIVTVPGKIHLADFALDAGAFALRFLAGYYDIPYPGDKLDMIGIPDFAFGAMENLGAVTYREQVLLVDPQQATQAELERVADVIAHELAHMWFGDLVTMKWWNGIWLNEAFATFMATKCIDAYRPDWQRWLSFGADRNHSMDVDGLATTRSIEFPVASPEEANEMFDTLTYEKGASVLRMLEQYLGEETFRRGISRYLKTHAYANTETADLWAALEAESGEPVGDIMDTWILQGGHPRVDVQRNDGDDGGGYRLSQEHFQFIGGSAKRWKVPVQYRSDSGEGRLLLDDEAVIEAGAGLVVNSGGQGYYRVAYADDLATGVVDNFAELDPAEQYGLIADTLAGVLAGDLGASRLVDVVRRLDDSTEPAVWEVALGGLSELDRAVSSDVRPDLQALVRQLAAPVADRLGWAPGEGETDLDRRFRGSMLRAMGNLGKDPETIAEARRLFAGMDAGTDGGTGRLDGEVVAAVLAIVAANGDRSDHVELVKRFHDAKNPQDEERYRGAMAIVPDREAVDETMAMTGDGRLRSHDVAYTVARMIGVRETGAYAWEAVKQSWDRILERVPALTARGMLSQIHHRSEPEVAADIKAWLADHEVPGSHKYTPQQLERLDVRLRLRESNPTLD
ncbi:MAG: M1 family metallopeptidase [Acidimicrobiia bacterium]|nr:M1 family metallopeptidase [Acidimicrobiia bacterium]